MNDPADKAALRRRFRRARLALGRNARQQAEASVIRRLKPLIRRHQTIGLYWPMGSELDLRPLMAVARQRGAHVYLPYIETRQRRLWFTRHQPDSRAEQQRAGRLSIPQFNGAKRRIEQLDLVLLPLVAIDRQGYRLGQGGGYYDASLAHASPGRPRKIGVGFACQLADSLPHEAHDCRLNGFVCETGSLRFSRKTDSPAPMQPLSVPYL